MKENLSMILKRMSEKKDSILVTVVHNSGSAPRSAGSHMVIGEAGRCVGTIGGGMVEFKAINLAQELLKEKRSFLKDFILAPNEIEDLGMVCGGQVKVLFHYIDYQQENLKKIFQTAYSSLEKQQTSWLIVTLAGDLVEVGFYSKTTDFMGVTVAKSYLKPTSYFWEEGDSFNYVEKISDNSKVYIFGGGHVAQALVPVLAGLNFHTIVYDDRQEFVSEEVFPLADERILGPLDDIFSKITLTENDYAVVMTRGHKADFSLELQLLETPAYYIGVIGSRHKVALHKKQLAEKGKSPEEIERLTMPIGIAIRAETPEEIAISIAGQLIQQRALRRGT
ncbi:xanthine dehydrogenase accessory protein XdhC [Vagococcus elongatus]|uniref:Xanthine dehydrogenase accessory protein XdhC n=1 Tax=Vagococcus elongatus TaxID=180344 RepID=A0A430AMJ7_9ENTE|nr:xanthine dehydrogenase accessory protein XdhC [Vagococcus elongatus]RSU09352.1 xanthine dehydrogenase accessory protein XdhC [Vagococcus elongatus]